MGREVPYQCETKAVLKDEALAGRQGKRLQSHAEAQRQHGIRGGSYRQEEDAKGDKTT